MGVRIHDVILAATLLTASPAFAGWQDQASPADIQRLTQLPQIREAALASARTGDLGRGDTRALDRVMSAQGRDIPAHALAGTWRCRELKMGRMSAYMVYDAWFTCAIRPVGGSLELRKLNGTQRFVGYLYPEHGAWVYLGASSAKGEPYH